MSMVEAIKLNIHEAMQENINFNMNKKNNLALIKINATLTIAIFKHMFSVFIHTLYSYLT